MCYNILAKINFALLQKKFLHSNIHPALPKNGVNSVKSGKTPIKCRLGCGNTTRLLDQSVFNRSAGYLKSNGRKTSINSGGYESG
jgi:hypothetical protein